MCHAFSYSVSTFNLTNLLVTGPNTTTPRFPLFTPTWIAPVSSSIPSCCTCVPDYVYQVSPQLLHVVLFCLCSLWISLHRLVIASSIKPFKVQLSLCPTFASQCLQYVCHVCWCQLLDSSPPPAIVVAKQPRQCKYHMEVWQVVI